MNTPPPRKGFGFIHAKRGYGCRITQVTAVTIRYSAININSAGGSIARKNWDKIYGGSL